MKKFNTKFIVSALLAASMVSASAISASAADYFYLPTYPGPSTGTVTENPTSDGGSETAGTTEDSPATVLTDDAVEQAIANGDDTVYMTEDSNGDVTVSEAAIGAIAEGDDPITIEVDSDTGLDYAITIDPDLITEVKAINLAMDIEVTSDGDEVAGVEIPANSIIITPAQSGDFGMVLTVTIPASELGDLDLDNITLYYFDDDGLVMELPTQITADNDGITIAISHASCYVITDQELISAGEDVQIEDDDKPSKDDNKGKDDSTVTDVDSGSDKNPITGTTLALGSLAVFAAAAVATKKRK